MFHVCHFCESNVEGHYFKNISKGLTEKGLEVSCLELGEHKPPQWLDQVPNVKYFSLGITSRFQYPLAVVRLARLMRREKIDILQTHLFNAGLIGVLAKRLYGSVFVALTRHHTSIVRDLGKNIHVELDKWMTRRADRAVGVSEAVKRFMVDIDGIPEEHVDVVHLGFNFDSLRSSPDKRSEIRSELEIPADSFVIGYVANFAPRKGHEQLVKAFARVVNEIPNSRLLLVGTGSLPEIDGLLSDFGVEKKVIFAGWREDVPACLSAMDLFVQPSLSEAFSQVIIEAMGAGIPVVATRVGGAAEVIVDKKTGMLIAADDVDALVESILDLFKRKSYRDDLAEAGRKSVTSRFTVENMVNKQFDLYRTWLNR